jgi:tripartite-type tricarboxylate transporter receptor subunit TctC
MNKRLFLQQILSVACMAILPGLALAQAKWPDKPIRLIIPTAPGGSSDLVAREFAQHLSERLGQPVVADNKRAGTVIGTDIVAKAPADGYAALRADRPHQNPLQMKSVPYDRSGFHATGVSVLRRPPWSCAAKSRSTMPSSS